VGEIKENDAASPATDHLRVCKVDVVRRNTDMSCVVLRRASIKVPVQWWNELPPGEEKETILTKSGHAAGRQKPGYVVLNAS
jgi:hypothetical protein